MTYAPSRKASIGTILSARNVGAVHPSRPIRNTTLTPRMSAAMALGAGILVGILVMLAASGIYAIMSFSVAERTREIGIRTTLGARRGSIALTVARRAVAQLGVGVLLGMPIARWLFLQLQVGSKYPASVVVLILGVSVVVLIGLLACTAPTLRALRIMPTDALREGV